jgi:hypothetical protein
MKFILKALAGILVSATLILPASLQAADKKEKVVEIGGMSIIGNRELPKTLYIVPWKDSDIDSETDLSRDLLNERLKVVDQEEFGRQLKYYDLSK